MEVEIQKCLYDAYTASEAIQDFLKDKAFEDYVDDLMLRSAVERQFEILGEALRRIRDRDENFLKQAINGWRGAISFRNILAHGYDNIDNEIVWGIIETDLSTLINSIKKYMD